MRTVDLVFRTSFGWIAVFGLSEVITVLAIGDSSCLFKQHVGQESPPIKPI